MMDYAEREEGQLRPRGEEGPSGQEEDDEGLPSKASQVRTKLF